MQESLKDKTVRGVGWSFIDNIASSGITFLVGLILARLLTPEEYGVMAMIAIFIAVSNSIIDSGFSNALIRKVHINRIDYNTVFYFNIVVSIVLYISLFLASPAISVFFKEPILMEVMRIIGFILIINALSIIPRTIFVRNVNFKTQTKVSLISSIYNPQIQISAESETKRSIFREKDKTKRSKKESAQHSKSRNKSFVMTSVSAL